MPFTNFAQILGLGMPEMIIILAILLLLFGGSKLPQLSRSLGQSMKELRKGMDGSLDEDEKKKQAANDRERQA